MVESLNYFQDGAELTKFYYLILDHTKIDLSKATIDFEIHFCSRSSCEQILPKAKIDLFLLHQWKLKTGVRKKNPYLLPYFNVMHILMKNVTDVQEYTLKTVQTWYGI